MTTFT